MFELLIIAIVVYSVLGAVVLGMCRMSARGDLALAAENTPLADFLLPHEAEDELLVLALSGR